MRNQPNLVGCVNSTNPTYCLLPSAFCLLPSAFCLLPSVLCPLSSDTHPPLFLYIFILLEQVCRLYWSM